ncbi:sugar O-acetyltransferase [Desulfovibrio sp. OttesenSCG-928-I05]|nr:sugar O-acetyltransferase [Desulfovibrio sp. OttesenSCG-928-I05]
MTEKEKMIRGENYDASDPALVAERLHAQALSQRYNTLAPDDRDGKESTLRLLLPNAGNDAYITAPFLCDYGYNIYTGERFYANKNCIILDVAPVRIGHDVKLGPMVQIYTATHPLDPEERASGIESGKEIVIGDKVWIGGGSVLCPGVSIGEGTVIGAGSVVTKDIPARVVAVGNPCRVIRSL